MPVNTGTSEYLAENRTFTVGHGVLWCGGLMAGLLRESRHLPAPLNKRRID